MTLPLVRFFNEWRGWGHPSAASPFAYIICCLKSSRQIPFTPQPWLCSNLTIQKYSLNWIGYSEGFSEWFDGYVPSSPWIAAKFFPQGAVSVCFLNLWGSLPTVWVLDLDWITFKLKMNFQPGYASVSTAYRPSHKRLQNLAIEMFSCIHIHSCELSWITCRMRHTQKATK